MSTPKESKGERTLRESSAGLLARAAPLLGDTISRALAAMIGGITDVEAMPLVGRKRSEVARSQQRVSDLTGERLSRLGLRESSFGLQTMEDIDRATASLLADVETSELERLTRLGEELGVSLTGMGLQGVGGAAQLGAQREATGSANKGNTFGTLGRIAGLAASTALLLNPGTQPLGVAGLAGGMGSMASGGGGAGP